MMFTDYVNRGLSGRLWALQSAFKSEPMPSPIIPFEGWSPDRPLLGMPGSYIAKGVIPDNDGFRPMKDFASLSTNSLTARARGAVGVRAVDGQVYVYAGDATKLYSLTAGTNAFSDVSGATYTTGSDSRWEFALYGSRLVATNYDDAVQSITLGGASFAALFTSTLKPKARTIAVVGDQLVMGDTNDAVDGAVPNRVWWTALNNVLDADPSQTTLSDFDDRPDGGRVRKIIGGSYGTVFLDSQIHVMDFVGPPLIYQFTVVDRARGTPIPGSVVAVGGDIFFICEEGFFRFNRSGSTPIGDGKIDRYFWANFNTTNRHNLFSAVDRVNKLVIWAVPSNASTTGLPDTLYKYHWPTGKFSYTEMNVEMLFSAMSQGYTLDSLDNVGTDIDNATLFPYSLDSEAWQRSELQLGAFNTSHTYGTLTGSNVEAVMETGEAQPFRQAQARVTGIRPLISNGISAVSGTITAAVAPRDTQQSASSFGTAETITADGLCEVDATGRYVRARVTVAAGASWSHAQGIELESVEI